MTISRPNSQLAKGVLTLVLLSSIVAVISGTLLTLWLKGDFKTKFKKAIMLTYPLTFIFFLIGYSVTLIETLIRQ